MNISQLYWQRKHAVISTLLLVIGLAFVYFPNLYIIYFKPIDEALFRLMNNSLSDNPWGYFWMLMNHGKEKALNVLMLLGVHLYAIYTLPKNQRAQAGIWVLCFWLTMQMVFTINQSLISVLTTTKRHSPSLVMEGSNLLSVIFDNHAIKDASKNSFPGGHSFAAFYWLLFTLNFVRTTNLKVLSVFIALLLLVARLFSGAHWMSDVVFSIISAYFAASLVYTTGLFKWLYCLTARLFKIKTHF
jgi:membrane-associated phospholipid phosphatase